MIVGIFICLFIGGIIGAIFGFEYCLNFVAKGFINKVVKMDCVEIAEQIKTEGYNAAYSGVKLSKNPYFDHSCREWWREGFLMAVYEVNGDEE